MRTIVAGSRSINQYSIVASAIADAPWSISVLISGGAKGIDELGEAYAYLHKIPLEIYNAEWRTKNGYDPGAGIKRNKLMATKAEALIAIWDGISPGTANMIENAKKHKLKIFVKRV